MKEERQEAVQEERESRLAHRLSRLLLYGLSVALALLVIGVIVAAVRRGVGVPRSSSVADIPRAIAAREPAGFFDLGLMVLLATPAVRVAALLLAFARRRMWLFSAVAILVLAIIAASAYLGLRAG